MKALHGVRVVDLTRALSGPFCSMILADLGADVIKVEPGPKGDMSRSWGPFDSGISTYYLSCNRNKRGICVDFRSAAGLDVVRTLCNGADIVMENFKVGTMEEMGLGYEALRAANPRLIMGSVSAFGSTGPLSGWPGFDQIAQGYSGLMSLTGYPDGEPTRTGTAIGDISSGMWLATALVSALYARTTTGCGQHVQTSLLESLVSLLSVHGQRYLSLGEIPARTGNSHAVIAPYGVFRTSDGPLNIAPITSDMWQRLCHLLDLPNLPEDQRFLTNELRVANKESLKEILESRLQTKNKGEWTQLFVDSGIPAGPINTLDEVFHDEQVVQTGIVESVAHEALGEIRQIVTPISGRGKDQSETNSPKTVRAAPRLGEHTIEVLAEAGYSATAIDELLGVKAITQA